MGLSSKNINQRFFGSDIRTAVKKKLEARQLSNEKSRNPGDKIKPSAYPDERPAYYTFDEVIDYEFGGEADMSSRTPFVRMWTAIQLFAAKGVSAGKKFESKTAAKDYLKNNPHHWWDDERDPDSDYKIWEKDPMASKIYEVGLNNFGQDYNIFKNIDDSQETPVGNLSVSFKQMFPNELKDNEFMKPQAGIKSVTSRTEDLYGYLKTTTISFVVYNFEDYQNIYMRYFLKPGSLIFVDFGWSNADLYKTDCVIFDTNCPERLKGKSIEEKLYGGSGFVTENEGDMETIYGTVSNWDSKLNSEGGYDCSVDIISRGSILVLESADNQEILRRKLINKLDTLIIQTTYNDFSYDGDKPGEIKNIFQDLRTDSPDATAWIILQKYMSYSWNQLPHSKSLVSGIFWNKQGNIKSSEQIWITWGLFEDTVLTGDILSKPYSGELKTEWDSRNTFVKRSMSLVTKQMTTDDLYASCKFLYPFTWGNTRTYNGRSKKLSNAYPYQWLEMDKFKHPEHSPMAMFDLSYNRVPVRELFINLHLIKTAFRKNSSTKAAVNEILQELYDNSEGIFDLKISICTSGGGGNRLAVIDLNSPIIDTIWNQGDTAQSEPEITKDGLRGLFMFKPHSPGSLILNFDYQFKAPSSDYLAMMALTNMNPLDNSIMPGSKSLSSYLSMKDMNSDEFDDYGVTYLPDPTDDLKSFDESDDEDLYTMFNDESNNMDLYLNSGKLALGKRLDAESAALGQISMAEVVEFETQIQSTNFVTGENEDLFPSTEIKDYQETFKERKKSKYRVAKNPDDYWNIITRTHDRVTKVSTLLPIESTLSMYGMSTIETGDVCRIDFLPESYRRNTYWQIGRVTHDISPSMWKTNLELLLKYKPGKKIKLAVEKKDVILDKQYISSTGLKNFGSYSQYFTNFRPVAWNKSENTGIKNVWQFEASEKAINKGSIEIKDIVVKLVDSNFYKLVGLSDNPKKQREISKWLNEATTVVHGQTWADSYRLYNDEDTDVSYGFYHNYHDSWKPYEWTMDDTVTRSFIVDPKWEKFIANIQNFVPIGEMNGMDKYYEGNRVKFEWDPVVDKKYYLIQLDKNPLGDLSTSWLFAEAGEWHTLREDAILLSNLWKVGYAPYSVGVLQSYEYNNIQGWATEKIKTVHETEEGAIAVLGPALSPEDIDWDEDFTLEINLGN